MFINKCEAGWIKFDDRREDQDLTDLVRTMRLNKKLSAV